MKNIKKLTEKFATKSISEMQSTQLKGGDDKRVGVSGSVGNIPPASGGTVVNIDLHLP